MNYKNIFKEWEPLKGIPDRIFIEAIYDDYEGFRILLRGNESDSEMLRISFERKISYQNSDEMYLLNLGKGNEGLILGKTFYIVENSEYAEFILRRAKIDYRGEGIKHYAIYTEGDCLDIISEDPPIVEWLR